MKPITILITALAVNTAFAADQNSQQWLDREQQTLPVQAGIEQISMNNNTETVQFSWPLDAGARIDSAARPFKQVSRQYALDTNGKALFKGVEFSTTSREALIRITPLQPKPGLAVLEQDIEINKGGRRWAGKESNQVYADHMQLEATGAEFGRGTGAFRLRPEMGKGDFTLAVKNSAVRDSSSDFVVHVFEPESSLALSLQASKDRYSAQDTAEFSLQLEGANAIHPDKLRGMILSPDGSRSWPLEFKGNGNSVSASAALEQLDHWSPGLWEVHTYYDGTVNGERIIRDAATAVAISPGTAQFNGRVLPGESAYEAAIAIDAAAAGRYEVRAVLYGSDSNGKMIAVAGAQSAAWLEAGQGEILLSVKPGDIIGATAPFEFRHLQLNDQSRMATLDAVEQPIKLR